MARGQGCSVTVRSPEPLGAAQNRGLDVEFLRDQFGRLGNTPYELARARRSILTGSPFAPASLLNQLRREAVEQLQDAQGASAPQSSNSARAAAFAPAEQRPPRPRRTGPQLHLLVRTPEQLEAAIDFRPASITLDYLDLYGLRPSLERIRAAGLAPRVASPRVLKPGEERIADFLLSCDCPILVRSAGLLHALRGRAHRRADRRFQPERRQRHHRRRAASTWASRASRPRTI